MLLPAEMGVEVTLLGREEGELLDVTEGGVRFYRLDEQAPDAQSLIVGIDDHVADEGAHHEVGQHAGAADQRVAVPRGEENIRMLQDRPQLGGRAPARPRRRIVQATQLVERDLARLTDRHPPRVQDHLCHHAHDLTPHTEYIFMISHLYAEPRAREYTERTALALVKIPTWTKRGRKQGIHILQWARG